MLSNKIQQTFAIIPQPIVFPAKNFRNTGSITKVANVLLKNTFEISQSARRSRHFPNLSQPEDCFEKGKLPRLVKADQNWLKALASHLCEQSISEGDSSRYVFIVRDEDLEDPYINSLSKSTKTPIVVYTVAEAKGQEFEAAILIFPFRFEQEQPSVDDLYEWYTSVTRARSYLALLVTDSELQWLNRKVSVNQPLNELFDIVQSLQPYEFAQQMQFEARTLITVEQLRQKKVRNLVKEINDCLIGRSPFRDFVSDRHLIGLSEWELAEHVYQSSQYGSQLEEMIDLDLTFLKPPIGSSLFNDLILFVASVPYLDNKTLNVWEDVLIQALENHFQLETDSVSDLLDRITEPFLRILILRSAGYSWDAAETATKMTHSTRMISRIALDLERRSLPLESARIRAQFLGEYLDSSTFLPGIMGCSNSLTDAMCKEFIQSFSKILEVFP